MGRPSKPTALHELQGTRPGATNRDRPDTKKALEEMREQAAEPGSAVSPLGAPPKSLKNSRGMKPLDCWHEIVARIPPGVALESDAFAVEIAARLLASYRAGLASAAEIGSLQRALASLGMTPSDRAKAGVAPPAKKDEPKADSGWDKLRKRRVQ